MRAVEGGAELGEIRHDETPGHRWRRGADIGGEVDERHVLLVADRGDDGHGAGRDGSHEALVGERQEIFEAAAAARDDDDVGTPPAELGDRGGDLRGGPRALNECLRDHDVRRGEPGRDRGDERRASPPRRCR